MPPENAPRLPARALTRVASAAPGAAAMIPTPTTRPTAAVRIRSPARRWRTTAVLAPGTVTPVSTLNCLPAPAGLADGLALEAERYRRITAGLAPTYWVPRSPPWHGGDSAPTRTRIRGGELREM